ncbi:FixH family protein [Sphingomonas sp. ID1715]|nr:FixH family protein [Sphingomonas sp. ID1715]
MAASMIGFFAVVIGVNTVMATQATRTFGGKVVENSYVASQEFNKWIAEAEAQERLGWTTDVSGRSGLVAVRTVEGADLAANAVHPLGRLKELKLAFVEVAPGRYLSRQPLPPGRWRLHLQVRRGGDRAAYLKDITL